MADASRASSALGPGGPTPFPEFRRDPIVNRWVVIAPERGRRPSDLEEPAHLTHHDVCPLCEGHEDETTPETLAYRTPGSVANRSGWQLRVVANLFPAVRTDVVNRPALPLGFASRPGVGVHEVVIECPRHESSLAALSAPEIATVFRAYRDRLIALRDDPRLAYVQVFKNHGVAAGASLEHTHSQILALPFVPADVGEEFDAASDHAETTGECIYCDLVARERRDGSRWIGASAHFSAIAAYAGRFPYETWVLPRRHAGHFDAVTDAELADLGAFVRQLLMRLAEVMPDLAYNYALHTLPLRRPDGLHYHWHIEVLPRTTGIAGFELATGCYANPVPPEAAAAALREPRTR